MVQGNLLQVVGQTDKLLATHNATRKFQVLTRAEMDSCTNVGQEWYCNQAEVALSEEAEQCLVALKKSRWERVKCAYVWHAKAAGMATRLTQFCGLHS